MRWASRRGCFARCRGRGTPLGRDAPDRSTRAIVAAESRPRLRDRLGRLRLDLYYRVAGVTIEIPPLRERREDISALAAHSFHALAGWANGRRDGCRRTPSRSARLRLAWKRPRART